MYVPAIKSFDFYKTIFTCWLQGQHLSLPCLVKPAEFGPSLFLLDRERDPACLTIAGSYDILFKNLKKRVKRCIDFPADKTKYAVIPWFHSIIASVAGKLKSSSLRIRSCPDGGITCFCCAERAARINFLAALIFLF